VTVRGIATRDETQLIFMDTPGLSDGADGLNRLLVQQARGAMAEADVVCFLVDAARKHLPDFETLGKGVAGKKVLVLTKVDLVKDKKKLLPILASVGELFDAVVPVSVHAEKTLDSLMKELLRLVPEGPWLFPHAQVTDMPLSLRLAELTREQAMRQLHEEVPYGVAVLPESITDVTETDGPMLVRQTILVARDGHKGIVLGKGGAMLKEIGTRARMEMQNILGRGVRLELHVEVDEKWADRADLLQALGVTH
jgi:GTP-binding protein Era